MREVHQVAYWRCPRCGIRFVAGPSKNLNVLVRRHCVVVHSGVPLAARQYGTLLVYANWG